MEKGKKKKKKKKIVQIETVVEDKREFYAQEDVEHVISVNKRLLKVAEFKVKHGKFDEVLAISSRARKNIFLLADVIDNQKVHGTSENEFPPNIFFGRGPVIVPRMYPNTNKNGKNGNDSLPFLQPKPKIQSRKPF